MIFFRNIVIFDEKFSLKVLFVHAWRKLSQYDSSYSLCTPNRAVVFGYEPSDFMNEDSAECMEAVMFQQSALFSLLSHVLCKDLPSLNQHMHFSCSLLVNVALLSLLLKFICQTAVDIIKISVSFKAQRRFFNKKNLCV